MPFTDQRTDVLLVPVTVAVNWRERRRRTEALAGETTTAMAVCGFVTVTDIVFELPAAVFTYTETVFAVEAEPVACRLVDDCTVVGNATLSK